MKALATAGFAALVLVLLVQAPVAPARSSHRLAAVAPQSARDDPGGSTWNADAAAFRGKNGSRYVYTCPSYGVADSIWGTDLYTDDSSVCTAAVHAGLITLAGGGTVTIEIRPGEASYTGSTRNGITSSSYPAWSGSYVIVSATAVTPGVGVGGATWDARAAAFRTYTGARFAYTCPPNGTPAQIWGTDVYTDDSSVCTAAVHAGLINSRGRRHRHDRDPAGQILPGRHKTGSRARRTPPGAVATSSSEHPAAAAVERSAARTRFRRHSRVLRSTSREGPGRFLSRFRASRSRRCRAGPDPRRLHGRRHERSGRPDERGGNGELHEGGVHRPRAGRTGLHA